MVLYWQVVKYESVIHEFDPYFNYRVTQVFDPILFLISISFEYFIVFCSNQGIGLWVIFFAWFLFFLQAELDENGALIHKVGDLVPILS